VTDQPKPNPGLGVDAAGIPVIDPTENVKALSEAANKRQDDLRDWLQKYIDTKIDGHIRLSYDRYEGIKREFDNIERRRIEHKADTTRAVDAAFSAAKEAVKEQAAASDKAISKSEGTVSGQIKAVEGTVDDLKDRIGKIETMQQTKSDVRDDSRSNVGMIVGIIGICFAFLSLLITIAVFAMRVGP